MRTQIFMVYRGVNLVFPERGAIFNGRQRLFPHFGFSISFYFLIFFCTCLCFLIFFVLAYVFLFSFVLSDFFIRSFFLLYFMIRHFFVFFPFAFLRIFSLYCCFSRRLLFSDSKTQDYKDLASENKLLESSY